MSKPAPATAGRERRFTELFERTYPAVLRFVERRFTSGQQAEDVTAEVFLVAWRRLDDVPSSHDEARAWLFGVARMTLLAGLRGQKRRLDLAVRIAARRDEPAPDMIAFASTRLDIAHAWQHLPAVHQEALALTVWDDLDAPQAAKVLGITAIAYRLRLSRARKALRAALDTLPSTANPDELTRSNR